MKSTNQWLDAAKTVLHIDSDRALAAKFDWHPSNMNHYRHARQFLTNTHAAQIAEVLGVNPLVIIADAETERAKNEKQRLFWANAAKKFGVIAASILMATAITLEINSWSYSETPSSTIFQIMLIIHNTNYTKLPPGQAII